MENSQRLCDRCERPLIKKKGRYGAFLGCSGFPACRYTEKLENYHKQESTSNPKSATDPFIGQKNTKRNYVNASSIGEVTFCPQSFYLREKSVDPSKKAVARMKKGCHKHAKVSRDKRCYIASHIFSEDHPVVESLRLWRDQVLMKNWYGQLFVTFYYALSPFLIKVFGRTWLFNHIFKVLITKMTKRTGGK